MKYVCPICGYVYDEDAEGVPFADLPDTWVCPLCRAPKAVFAPAEVKEETVPTQSEPDEVPELDEDLRELSAGELAPLFSNLARGCEKQYMERESKLFLELASYFDSITPATPCESVDELANAVMRDIQGGYADVERVCRETGDRGALRANTWGQKVTMMQQALLGRYQQEGEAFLTHTNVWVCSVCGFIYVGDTAPELCPVCKVPAWKFDQIQGGVSK